MDKIIELARKAAAQNGDTLRDAPEKETVEFIHAFYLLARADLEAENAKLRTIIERLLPLAEESLVRPNLDETIIDARAALGEK